MVVCRHVCGEIVNRGAQMLDLMASLLGAVGVGAMALVA
jgi:hypothetical protein